MQRLAPVSGGGDAGVTAERCAWELLDAVPPLMWHIRRSMRSFRRGLSMPQFRAMVFVSNEPAVSLSTVADHLALSLPTTSRMVSGLVDKGLLTRHDSSTDRRQVSIGVTAKGRAVLDVAWSGTGRELAGHLVDVPADRRESVVAAMAVVRDLFGSLGLPPLDAESRPPPPAGGRRKPAVAPG
jgi:DNA-binding MarR family transcriptional regulator